MAGIGRAGIRAGALVFGLVLAAAGPAQAAGEPVNRERPKLTLDGGTLTTSDGTWVGATRGFTYAWFRCDSLALSSCVQVPGQAARRYALSAPDGGKRIRSRVTAANQVGADSEFSAATAVVARTKPAPGKTEPPRRLSPFPVVVVAGRNRATRTRVTELVVRGPRGARVSVVCRGKRCPMRRTVARIGSKRRVRMRRAQRLYRVGQVLEVRITAPERIGKLTRIRFRRGNPPARRDLCVVPGRRGASSCLTS